MVLQGAQVADAEDVVKKGKKRSGGEIVDW